MVPGDGTQLLVQKDLMYPDRGRWFLFPLPQWGKARYQLTVDPWGAIAASSSDNVGILLWRSQKAILAGGGCKAKNIR